MHLGFPNWIDWCGGHQQRGDGSLPFHGPSVTVPVWHPQPGTSFATSSFAGTLRGAGPLEDKHSLEDTMSQSWPLSEFAWGFLLSQTSNFP